MPGGEDVVASKQVSSSVDPRVAGTMTLVPIAAAESLVRPQPGLPDVAKLSPEASVIVSGAWHGAAVLWRWPANRRVA